MDGTESAVDGTVRERRASGAGGAPGAARGREPRGGRELGTPPRHQRRRLTPLLLLFPWPTNISAPELYGIAVLMMQTTLKSLGVVLMLSAAIRVVRAASEGEGELIDTYLDDSDGSENDDNANNCTDLGRRHDPCQWVADYCQDASDDGLFNYLELRYCHGDPFLTLLGLIPWLCLLISLLATTADNFFVPQLQVMSDKLRLRPEVAGVTLLALGNGAPDVFTAVSGIDGANDFPLVLGELLGASMMISTVVLGGVLLVSPPDTDVIRNSFIRDVLVYIAATATIFAIALDGVIKLYEALLLLVFYFSYVALVVCTTRKAGPESAAGRGDSLETDSQELSQSLLSGETLQGGGSKGNDYFIGLSWESDASVFYKIQFVVEWPFSVLRWLSIPSAEPHWSRKHRFFASTGPLGCAAMVLLDAAGPDGFTDPWIAPPVLGCSAALSVAVWFLTNDKDLPKYHFGLVLLGFASTIVWLDVIANETVAVLEAFGIMINVSTSILGLTVLAMGNSIGDFVADVAVARAGQPTMGIASCFGSPLLNDVVGLGISLTVTTVADGDLTAKLNPQCRLAYIFLWVSLLSSLATFTYTGFRAPGKFYALYLFALYFLFLLMSCLHEANVITWQF